MFPEDIILTQPGLSAIFDAVVESRKIFARLRSYVLRLGGLGSPIRTEKGEGHGSGGLRCRTWPRPGRILMGGIPERPPRPMVGAENSRRIPFNELWPYCWYL